MEKGEITRERKARLTALEMLTVRAFAQRARQQ